MDATRDLNIPEKDQKDQDIFDVIGSFGPWQKRVFVIVFIVHIFGAFQSLAVTFLAPNVDFWCVSPPLPNDSSILSSFNIYNSVNRTDDGYVNNGWRNFNVSQCEVPVLLLNDSFSEYPSFTENYSELVPCVKWDYDKSEYSDTVVSEWDLVCNKEWLVSFLKSVYMIGFMLAVLLMGQISDWIGRFSVMAIAYFISIFCVLLSLFSTSYLMFAVLRFFLAFGKAGFTTSFVLIMELVGPEHQTEVGVAIQLGWSVGFFLLPGLAYFVRPWVWFMLASAAPIFPMIFVYRLIPESPRWLLTQGKIKQLQSTLMKAAKLNGRELKCDVKDMNFVKNMKNQEKENKSKSIFDVFKAPRLRKRVLNVICLWIVNSFIYYGLSFNTNDLAGNPYLNFFIAGLLEFPCYAVVFYGIKHQGRRITLVIFMLIAGAACGVIIFIPEHLQWLKTFFAMVGKFCVTGSYTTLYIYTCELFPTVVRNVCIGSCSMSARIGSILAPFVRELGKATYPWIPNCVFAALAIGSGLLAIMLPETRNQKYPNTLEEGENLGK